MITKLGLIALTTIATSQSVFAANIVNTRAQYLSGRFDYCGTVDSTEKGPFLVSVFFRLNGPYNAITDSNGKFCVVLGGIANGPHEASAIKATAVVLGAEK